MTCALLSLPLPLVNMPATVAQRRDDRIGDITTIFSTPGQKFRGPTPMWSGAAAVSLPTMRGTQITFAVALSGLAASLGACGGGGGDDGLSRSAISSKASAICAKAQTQARAIPAPSADDMQNPTVAAAYFDKIAPITAKETTDLKALNAADDVSSDWNALVAAQEQANTLLQTIKRKADSQDPSGLQDLGKVASAGQKVSDAAKKVGASSCA